MRIVLASASPRRRELMERIGLEFEVCVSDAEEKITKTDPAEVVEELSRAKACNVRDRLPGEDDADDSDLLVIGADTIVYCEGRILGKPKDKDDAGAMLGLLQGREHHVYTGVTMIYRGMVKTFYEVTGVLFWPMTHEEILDYIETGEPMDKAGSYGIQGPGCKFIKSISGDYCNVVGLPVSRVYQEIVKIGRGEFTGDKKAVIFDVDGTLLDTLESIKYCGDHALEPWGYGPFSADNYRYFAGDGAANLVKRALKAGGDEELVHFDETYSRYLEIFKEHCMYHVKPYDGIPELLGALRERNIRIAVLSNKPHAETVNVIESMFGENTFDVIVGQKDDVPIKPSPAGVFLILDEMGLKPQDVLYLGDTATDMLTGKSAGAFTVGALWGFRDEDELKAEHADAIISTPMELMNYL